MSTTRRWAGLALGVGAAAVFGTLNVSSALAVDSIYECNKQNGGKQVALLVHHTDGTITPFPAADASGIQAAIDAAQGDVVEPSSTASGAGDTVIVCRGTYKGNLHINAGNDMLTVRSEDGPNGVNLIGDGTAPVVSIQNRGTSFGGPGEGFTISVVSATASTVTGIQVGIPGAQDTSNEDEACTTAGLPNGFSGCDEDAPRAVTLNDQIFGNKFTNFQIPATATLTAIKSDNTINTVIQQNLIQHVIRDHRGAGEVNGIVVGGFKEAPPSTVPVGFSSDPGDSTNINVGLYDNAIDDVVDGSNATCQSANGIKINGFVLDAGVYNNRISQLTHDNSTCKVTGIFSNAYGTLENEQTGTLAPTNANIDNNSITHLANRVNLAEGIVLAPTPADATPGPEPSQPGCALVSDDPAQMCDDSIPPSSYTVVDNELQQVGIAVHDEAVLGQNSFIRFNNFDSDLIGVQNDASAGTGQANTRLDATNNWWG